MSICFSKYLRTLFLPKLCDNSVGLASFKWSSVGCTYYLLQFHCSQSVSCRLRLSLLKVREQCLQMAGLFLPILTTLNLKVLIIRGRFKLNETTEDSNQGWWSLCVIAIVSRILLIFILESSVCPDCCLSLWCRWVAILRVPFDSRYRMAMMINDLKGTSLRSSTCLSSA